jgi:hypothetical protein
MKISRTLGAAVACGNHRRGVGGSVLALAWLLPPPLALLPSKGSNVSNKNSDLSFIPQRVAVLIHKRKESPPSFSSFLLLHFFNKKYFWILKKIENMKKNFILVSFKNSILLNN